MGVIRVLSDQVANKIAAGEVVERPVSVIKELVENALDAGARRIRVEVEGGGRARMRLIDDGCGMVRDDALLALERHATSKLRDVSELEAIATLGFRGEAVPSIAAVSHFTLETAPAEGPGTRIQVEGGVVRKVEEAGLPPGTAITVARLFYNVPARRKFLKSEGTELGHITTLITHYALAYPEVHFHLETPHRVLLEAPAVTSHAQRLRQIFGEETQEPWLELRDQARWPVYPAEADGEAGEEPAGGLGIFGYISRPEVQKLNRNSIFIFVNRRLVRDRLLLHAVSAAYANLLPNQVYPAVLLFLDLPYAEVDVNVHPSKVEVRFRRQGFIHDAVRDAIRRTLGEARPVPSFLQERGARPNASPAWSRPRAAVDWPLPTPAAAGVPAGAGLEAGGVGAGLEAGGVGQEAFALRPATLPPLPQMLPLTPGHSHGGVGGGCGELEIEAAAPGSVAEELGQLTPLGQIRDSFIVAAGRSGLWLIDQHVAHERVLFEQIERQRQQGSVPRQGLLMPRVVALDPGRWAAFTELAPELEAAGFEVAPFGGRSVAITTVPAGLPAEGAEALLAELLEGDPESTRALTLEQLRTRIAATIACHAAIKINMRLEPDKMRWLLGALAQTAFPMTCPHGRPVLLRYPLQEIQRAFKRIK